MYKITSLGAEPKQEITVLLSDTSRVVFNFEYKANQLGWFFGFKYGNYSVQNMRLTTNYNILESFRSYIPFGLRCDTPDNEEPYDIEDFARGYASVYVLTDEDKKIIESKYYSRDEVVNAQV